MRGIGVFQFPKVDLKLNNNGGEKTQGLASGFQQDERTCIGILHKARKYQEIESSKRDVGEMCQ